MPITWQNINAPSLGDPGRALANAGQAITDAFTPLREQLKAYQTNEAQNYEVGKANNTEAFMAQLTSRYKTPEALAAAQQSGELDALRSSFGAQIDQARTREALDTRGGVLQQRDLTERTYKNQVIEDTIRPQMQAALGFIQKGDKAGFDAFLNDPANAQLKAMKQGDLMARLTEFERATAEEGRKVSGENRAVVAQAELLRNGEATRQNMVESQRIARRQADTAAAAQASNAAYQTGSLGVQKDVAQVQAQERLETRLTALNQSLAKSTMTIGSKEGTEAVSTAIATMSKNAGDTVRLRAAFGAIAEDPELSRAHPAAVIQALSGSVSTSGDGVKDYFRNSTGDSAADRLREIMKSPAYTAERERDAAGVSSLTQQANLLKTSLGYPTSAPASAAPKSAESVTLPAAAPVPKPLAAPQKNPVAERADRVKQISDRLEQDDRIKSPSAWSGGIINTLVKEGALPLGLGERRDLERELAKLRSKPKSDN